MKKYLIFTIFAFMLSLCRAEGATFAELTWGASREETIKQLERKGFSSSLDKGGDIKFNGQLLGYKTDGLALLAGKRLSKVVVNLQTPDKKAREVYKSLKDTLTKKYGEAENSFEYFNEPYYEGDGYEEQAIKLGKGKFATFWPNGIYLQISDALTVKITYEGPLWEEEVERRKQSRDSIF
jgi:hypothetical protein